MALFRLVLMLHSAGVDVASADPPSADPPPKMGLLLALYNANVTTDWVKVAVAAQRIPVRVIVPVPGVTPPDPDWAPDYPSAAEYRKGVSMLQAAGVEVYAYTHLRNISLPCCTCCGNLTQFEGWVDRIKHTASFDGVMMDNLDAPWSSFQYRTDGLQDMFIPAAKIVGDHRLGVWANGPHLSANGAIEANRTAWQQYLELATFTTLFEMPVANWLTYPMRNFSETLGWPADRLGGYVLDIPDNTSAAGPAIDASLRAGVERGLSWMYPTIKCMHASGPHHGSCTYAHLPSYWDVLISSVEKLNAE